jgi:hypothetical protein
VQRVVERERRRQAAQHEPRRQRHAAHHHHHLVGLRAADRARAARDGVGDGGAADDQVGELQRPAEQRREHDGGREDGDARRQPARQEEQERGQLARFAVESLFQVFVGGIDLEPIINGQEEGRDDDHGDGQPEIELHEAHPLFERLARHRQEGDGARLRRHDRQADGPPAQVAAAAQVGVGALGAALAPGAVADDGGERADEDRPVERLHARLIDRPR